MQIRILCDASQPTYDQSALGGHHGVARARFGAAATRRRDPNHSDQTCFNARRLLFCKRAPKGYCPVRRDCASMPPVIAPPANQSRYALYLAPPPDSDLWRFGCAVIGRDPLTGAACEGFSPEGYPLDSWRSMTSDPRRYGFHATLKAPFPLRLDLDPADLFDGVAELARRHSPFDAGELSVGVVKAGHGLAFVALKPQGALKELRSFEASIVRGLDRLRAPFVESGREYRRSERLTPRQAYYLHAWGYPYVLDEFDPHFTLTNAIPDADRVARLLEWEFGLRVPSRPLHVAALTLFGQGEPGGEFRILRRFPLGRPRDPRRSTRALATAVLD
jgi:hypothetical protein